MATKRRSTTPTTLASSQSESSLTTSPSLSDFESPETKQHVESPESNYTDNAGSITLHGIVTSTAFRRRISRQSSLSWGHKPSPLIGASCFLFLLPIPLLCRSCCFISAFLLGCVTISSYLSDHVYTGLESWAHLVDRTLAPCAFLSCAYATLQTCGIKWSLLGSLVAVKCHVWANYYSKHGMYEQFVIWHSLWHAVGVGVILICYMVNSDVGTCWEGSNMFL